MNVNIKTMLAIMLLAILLISTNSSSLKITKDIKNKQNQNDLSFFDKNLYESNEEDLDPYEDIHVTVEIKKIRAFDKLDRFSDPDFYIKLFINDQEYKSPTWHNQKVVTPSWKKTVDVPDDKEIVNITIQLWDANPGLDELCDIAKNDNENPFRKDLTLFYSLKTGHWTGDDLIYWPHSWSTDYSGYGRASGTDDNSIYENDKDCEIWFDITQSDHDGDGIPYWTEVNVFGTDPTIDDTGRDDDNDGVPIEWEWKWGYKRSIDYINWTYVHDWEYDPFEWEDHKNLDPDGDGLTNYEEYLTSQWGSDPFRKDIFVELDQMEGGPNGEPASLLPEKSKEKITEAFNRQNIVFHLDDGTWEDSRSDMIPFDPETDGNWSDPNNELEQIYRQYFLNNTNDSSWRIGVFHYGVVIRQSSVVNGNAFGNNRFQISAKGLDEKAKDLFTSNRDIVYATAYMHELGHSLGLMWLGGHSDITRNHWLLGYLLWHDYQSIMNYAYMYGIAKKNFVDYSDGIHGRNDFDDWSNIDYSYFKQDLD